MAFIQKYFAAGLIGTLSLVFGTPHLAAADPSVAQGPVSIDVSLKMPGTEKLLKSWSLSELEGKRSTSLTESVAGAASAKYQGIRLKTWIEDWVKGLSATENAEFDWISMISQDGTVTHIPRVFANRFGILVASRRGGVPLGDQGPLALVLPLQSEPKIKKEKLPVERLSRLQVKKIELASTQGLFGAYLLQKRSDPTAVKGERLFIQSCLACHGDLKSKLLAPSGKSDLAAPDIKKSHAATNGMPPFDESDWRAINAYVRVFVEKK